MTFGFNRVTFEDQLQKIQRTGRWLDSIGIQTHDTRFDEILHLNKEIVEHHQNNLVEDLTETYGNLKLWFALTEASSYIQIYEAFKEQKSHVHPRAKLEMMLKGTKTLKQAILNLEIRFSNWRLHLTSRLLVQKYLDLMMLISFSGKRNSTFSVKGYTAKRR